jgi:hypothetical protein
VSRMALTRLRKLEASQVKQPVLVWFDGEIVGDFERRCQALVESGRARDDDEFQGIRWLTRAEAEARGILA